MRRGREASPSLGISPLGHPYECIVSVSVFAYVSMICEVRRRCRGPTHPPSTQFIRTRKRRCGVLYIMYLLYVPCLALPLH